MTHKSVAQRSTLPVLERLRDMKDGQNGRNGRNGLEGNETPGELLPSVYPEAAGDPPEGVPHPGPDRRPRPTWNRQAAKTASADSGEEEQG